MHVMVQPSSAQRRRLAQSFDFGASRSGK